MSPHITTSKKTKQKSCALPLKKVARPYNKNEGLCEKKENKT